MSIDKYTVKQILNIEACTRCGLCSEVCSAYNANMDIDISPAKKLELLKKRIRANTLFGKIFSRHAFTQKELGILAKGAYECTLCSRCEVDCPVNIDLQKLWISLRADMADEGKSPEALNMLKERLEKSYNISFDSNQGRVEWINQVEEIPEDKYVREKADVVYFVGCVSSFSPRVFKIPRSVVSLFKLAKVDFALLGDEEWCCGFPLLGSGFKQEFIEFAKHNIEKVNATGARYLVTSCPSCYHMWTHTYREANLDIKMNFKVLHTVQYLYELAKSRALKLYPLNLKVTYHDPCDLGRNSGIYDEPRELIKKIPGTIFVELENNRENAECCGGGGNVEAVDRELSEKIAQTKAREIIKTRAEIVVTACQQCVRTISGALKKQNSKIKVMDISELILLSATANKD
ncbi:MAG: (Fe-S)-binding protein [Actinobacteria bacterium]|nr:(Fe-S)-binding protein [Actinomycetota bacterium]